MALAGISTLGVLFGYGIGSAKPTKFNKLNRINALGGLSLQTEKIDASALEDVVSAYVAGRSDSGGSLPVTINITDETIKEWEDLIDEYNAMSSGEEMWFEICAPKLTKAFFIKAQPPQMIPLPESAQNGLWTVEISLTVSEYVGLDTKVTPVDKTI